MMACRDFYGPDILGLLQISMYHMIGDSPMPAISRFLCIAWIEDANLLRFSNVLDGFLWSLVDISMPASSRFSNVFLCISRFFYDRLAPVLLQILMRLSNNIPMALSSRIPMGFSNSMPITVSLQFTSYALLPSRSYQLPMDFRIAFLWASTSIPHSGRKYLANSHAKLQGIYCSETFDIS